MRTPADKAAHIAGSKAFQRKKSLAANPHADKRTRVYKSWVAGWMGARDKFMVAPEKKKKIGRSLKSMVHGERGYMIFNKDTGRLLCNIGVFEKLSGAGVDRKNRQKTTNTKLGICRVTVTVSGRTW